jgi:hypothetical protein
VTYAAAPGAKPVISGAGVVPRAAFKPGKGQHVVAADVGELAPIGSGTVVWVDQQRYWPARYPNGDPARCLFPDCYDTNCSWG